MNRVAGKHNTLARKTLADQMAFALLRIWHINGRNRVDDTAVFLFGHFQVIAAVARLHMHNRNAHPLGENSA
ncbi:hypothetical protein D3C80_2029620 [compost metagenome]